MTVNTRSRVDDQEWAQLVDALTRPRPRYCICGHDRAKASRQQRLPLRNAALAGVGVHPSIAENA